jgi:hypothetical protein
MYAAVRKAGLLTTGEVCQALGISETSYHRLEAAGVFPEPKRWRKPPRPDMRVFSPTGLAALKRLLARKVTRSL